MKKSTKWGLVGLVAVLSNPIPTGIVLGHAMYTEPDLKSEGKIVISASIFLTIVYLIFWLIYLKTGGV
jgi:hypothetical protein